MVMVRAVVMSGRLAGAADAIDVTPAAVSGRATTAVTRTVQDRRMTASFETGRRDSSTSMVPRAHLTAGHAYRLDLRPARAAPSRPVSRPERRLLARRVRIGARRGA